MSLTSYFMEATYLVASILFILSLKMMSHPETARRGARRAGHHRYTVSQTSSGAPRYVRLNPVRADIEVGAPRI